MPSWLCLKDAINNHQALSYVPVHVLQSVLFQVRHKQPLHFVTSVLFTSRFWMLNADTLLAF